MDEERSVELRAGDHWGGTNWVALTERRVADPLKRPPNNYLPRAWSFLGDHGARLSLLD